METSHKTSVLRSVRKKTRRKMLILRLRHVKCQESRAKCSFWCSSRWLLWCRCSVCGVSCKTFPRERLQNNKLSCCFAWQAWHFVKPPSCFMTCQKWFCVAGAKLLRRFQTMRCIFRGRRSTLETSDVMLRGKRSTLDVSCCVFSVKRLVSTARSGDKVQIP